MRYFLKEEAKTMRKKSLSMLLIFTLVMSMCGCGAAKQEPKNAEQPQTTTEKSVTHELETTKVKVAYAPSQGNLFQMIAEDKGFLAEEGLEVEETLISNGADAYSALGAETVDVLLAFGTCRPLSQIANGGDYTIFAGALASGATPIIAKEETEFNGLKDFVGKKIGCIPASTSDITLRALLVNEGYDLEKDFEWVEFKKTPDALEAVRNGQVDFATMPTGQEITMKQYGLKAVLWPDEYWPNHSCCRVVARTEWLNEHSETAQALLRAYLKAGQFLEDTDYTVGLMVDKLNLEKETVESFVLSEHFVPELDPLKNTVLKVWDTMNDIGYIDSDINIEKHINTELYKKALDELAAAEPDNEYFAEKQTFFKSMNE